LKELTDTDFFLPQRKKIFCDGQWAACVWSITKLWKLELKLGMKDLKELAILKHLAFLRTGRKPTTLTFSTRLAVYPCNSVLDISKKLLLTSGEKGLNILGLRKSDRGGSAEFTKSAFKYRDSQLWLAKCSEPLNIVWSRYLPTGCSPSTVTVKLEPSGRWFVSLLVDDYTVEVLPPTKKQIGIDAALTSLISTSDGEKVANPKHLTLLYQKLKVAQKELSSVYQRL